MQSSAFIRTVTLTLAIAAPHAVLAGHEEFVRQHRFTRAELSGVLYLPGDAQAAIATGTPVSPDTSAALITASHTCSDSAAQTCATNATDP